MLTFKILGPLEIVRDGKAVRLGAAKQRALLACLLLHANEPVSTDRLIEDLWGEDAPANPEHLLHQYVSRLRKVLEENGRRVLVTRAPGYLIELGTEDVLDAVSFQALVRQARSSVRERPAEALELLDRALELWRGPALADFAYDAFAQNEARRMEELRAVAEEERVEALLALGRHKEAIPELDSLVARYPLREHLRAQQMLALYRAGRQADALGAFQAARQTLAAELGVDLGPEIRALEGAILRHDPDLRAPEPARPSAAGVPESTVSPSRRRSWLVPVVAIPFLVMLVVAVGLVLPIGESETPNPNGSSGSPAPDPERALEWVEAGSDEFTGDGDQVVLGGVRTNDGYLAFGYTAPPASTGAGAPDFDAAVWRAATPGGWMPAPTAPFDATGSQRAVEAAVRGNVVVLVGWDESGGDFDAAVWLSETAGSTWARTDKASLAIADDQRMRDVAASGSLFLAVGWENGFGDEDAMVWTSVYGRKWDASRPLTAEGDQEMTSVTISEGVVVAGGWSVTEDDRDALAWTSTVPKGGELWRPHRDENLGGPGDQQINAVTTVGAGFIAVGEETIDGDTDAVLWTSSDGREWDRVHDASGVFGGEGDQRMFAVASSSELGIVVAAGAEDVGSEVDALDPIDAAVWTSSDGGRTWDRLPETPETSALTNYGSEQVKALIPIANGFLALGTEGREADKDADAWIGRPIA